MLKAAIKHGAGDDQVRHRIVPLEVITKWLEELERLKDEISAVLQDEKEEKHVSDNYFVVYIARSKKTSASESRNGIEEGRKHDRTRG